MKKLHIFLFIPLMAILSIYFAFRPLNPIEEESRLKVVKTQLLSDLDIFEERVEKLEKMLSLYQESKIDAIQLRRSFLSCREAYKKTEFLLTYFQEQAVKDFINGAPLPSLEPNSSALVVLEPEGLQIMDEVIYEEEIDVIALHLYTDKLRYNLRNIIKYQKGLKIYDANIFEASREELVRIFTLGLSGFDTPGSLNAISEAKMSFEAMHFSFMQYQHFVEEKKFDQLKSLFIKSRLLLSDQSFEGFDRLEFLTEIINPLYDLILDIQLDLGIELPNEQNKKSDPYNYLETNLFSSNFLNPHYYSQIKNSNKFKDQVALGKLLFFDPLLSKNLNGSCASCHNPQLAFTDGKKTSSTFNGQGNVQRNAPTLINAVFADRYFYDLRAHELRFQLDHVVFNSKEFDTNFAEISERLSLSNEYVERFNLAYPNHKYSISAETVRHALSAYITSLTALSSPFDQYVRGESKHLNESAKKGFNLFTGKAACATCHFSPIFNGSVPPHYEESESEVLGVLKNPYTKPYKLDNDLGRIDNKIDKEKAAHFKYSFKTPTLRNIEYSAPYMHNGAYQTLEDVMKFYNLGGGVGHGLVMDNQTLGSDPLELSDTEIGYLIDFMLSLSDTTSMNHTIERLPKLESKPQWDNRLHNTNY